MIFYVISAISVFSCSKSDKEASHDHGFCWIKFLLLFLLPLKEKKSYFCLVFDFLFSLIALLFFVGLLVVPQTHRFFFFQEETQLNKIMRMHKMRALLDPFWSTAPQEKDPPGINLFYDHFRRERTEHQLALRKGNPPPASPVHFWKRRTLPDCAGRCREWTIDTLLVSGYDIFQLLGNPIFYKAVKTVLDVPVGVLANLVPATSLEVCLWTAYQKIPNEVRLEFNAAAYELTSDRCKIVKNIELDPPRRVGDPALLKALSAFTATDTAQLIIEFAVDPYLPNHLRCCASTIKNRRCIFPRSERYCPIPVGCCPGFKVEHNICLYDVCSFHLLRRNCTGGSQPPYSLVSCD